MYPLHIDPLELEMTVMNMEHRLRKVERVQQEIVQQMSANQMSANQYYHVPPNFPPNFAPPVSHLHLLQPFCLLISNLQPLHQSPPKTSSSPATPIRAKTAKHGPLPIQLNHAAQSNSLPSSELFYNESFKVQLEHKLSQKGFDVSSQKSFEREIMQYNPYFKSLTDLLINRKEHDDSRSILVSERMPTPPEDLPEENDDVMLGEPVATVREKKTVIVELKKSELFWLKHHETVYTHWFPGVAWLAREGAWYTEESTVPPIWGVGGGGGIQWSLRVCGVSV